MNNTFRIILAASAITLAACDSNDDDAPVEPSVPSATVQVLHASPNAPAVNIAVDGEEALTGIDYKDSSGWITVDEGSYSVEVQAILPGRRCL